MSNCDNPQPGNVQFNYAQLEYIWSAAGGSGQTAPIAAAIAMAESGGNSGATNCDSNGTIDRGLWQINSVHGSQSTYDVMGNARAAVAISNSGGNWQPWTTYTSGAYQRYLQSNIAPSPVPVNATNAQANLTGAFGIPGIPSQLDPSWWSGQIGQSVGQMILGMLNPMIQMIAGTLGVAAGGVLVIGGIFVLVRQSQAGRDVTDVAMLAAAPEAEVGQVAGREAVSSETRYQRVGSARRSTTVRYRAPQGPKPIRQQLRDESQEYVV